MRKKLPQRRVKILLRSAGVMAMIFAITILVCTVIFFFTKKEIGILSPIFQSAQGSMGSATIIVQDLCKQDHIACTNVSMDGDATVVITLDNGATAYVSAHKDLKKQLASLQQVASQLTIKGKQFKTLDFRFDHIVVTF